MKLQIISGILAALFIWLIIWPPIKEKIYPSQEEPPIPKEILEDNKKCQDYELSDCENNANCKRSASSCYSHDVACLSKTHAEFLAASCG